jgi:mitogen-activated protein kinase 1/3
VYTVQGKPFEVDTRYDVKRLMGAGACGTVCSAVDSVTGERVAIKRVTNLFRNLNDGKRVLRELKILAVMRHRNVLQLHRVLPVADRARFNDVYMVTNVMDTDLSRIVRSSQQLRDAHCNFFIVQLLRGVKYVHSAGVIHRDIKPQNILVDADCKINICDFGLAREYGRDPKMTIYVVTRWYRAPELLLLNTNYGPAVDMWSVGCILAELLLRKPLFAGRDYLHQLHIVVSFTGTPSVEDLADMSADSRRYVGSMKNVPPADIAASFPAASAGACDLLSQLLCFDPKRRPSAAEALEHPYFANARKAAHEGEAPQPWQWSHEEDDFTEPALRNAFADLGGQYDDGAPSSDVDERGDAVEDVAAVESAVSKGIASKSPDTAR